MGSIGHLLYLLQIVGIGSCLMCSVGGYLMDAFVSLSLRFGNLLFLPVILVFLLLTVAEIFVV